MSNPIYFRIAIFLFSSMNYLKYFTMSRIVGYCRIAISFNTHDPDSCCLVIYAAFGSNSFVYNETCCVRQLVVVVVPNIRTCFVSDVTAFYSNRMALDRSKRNRDLGQCLHQFDCLDPIAIICPTNHSHICFVRRLSNDLLLCVCVPAAVPFWNTIQDSARPAIPIRRTGKSEHNLATLQKFVCD